jgi:hypothetical protein
MMLIDCKHDLLNRLPDWRGANLIHVHILFSYRTLLLYSIECKQVLDMFGVPAKEAKHAKETKRQTQVDKVQSISLILSSFLYEQTWKG